MKNFIKVLIISVLSVGLLAGFAPAQTASAQSTKNCSVTAVQLGSWGKAISVSGDTATASFTVEGSNCMTPVTLASWKRVTAEGINDQVLYAHTTKTFAPGRHSLSVKLPVGMYQVDVVEGSNATAWDGTANYQYQNGKFVDGGLRDFLKGTRKVEVVEEKPPVVEEVIPEETPVEEPVEAPVEEAPVQEPVALPNTGAGSVAALFTVSSTAGAGLSYLRKRRNV